MTFSSFLLLLTVVYVLYYTVVILLDKVPAKKILSVQKVDLVVADSLTPPPVKVEASFECYMPVIDHEEEDDELTLKDQNASRQSNRQEDTECLQAALRMETWSEEPTELELTAEELCFALA